MTINKMRRSIHCFVLLCSLHAVPASAIIDVQERYKAISREGASNVASFSLDGSEGIDDSADVVLANQFTWRSGKTTLMAIGSIEYGESASRKTDDHRFLHLRYVKRRSERWSMEAYLQHLADEFVEVQRRNLAGAGVRYEGGFGNEDRSDNESWFAVGAGVFRETERYVDQPDDQYETRGNFYVAVGTTLSEGRTRLALTTYWQPVVSAPSKFRSLSNFTLTTTVTKALSLEIGIGHRHNTEPVAGVGKWELDYVTGIRYVF